VDGNTLDQIQMIKPNQTVLVAVAVKFGKTRLIDNILIK